MVALLELDRTRLAVIWTTFAAGVALAIACTLAGLDVPGTTGRIIAATCAGLLLARLVEQLWWIAVAAFVVSLADSWSVFSSSGITHQVVAKAPRALHWATVQVPILGVPLRLASQVGVTDLLFLAMFLASAHRWHLGMQRNVLALAASFSVTLALDVELLPNRPIPALPMLALAMVLVNAPAIARSWRSRPR
jgi:hypothetical protein